MLSVTWEDIQDPLADLVEPALSILFRHGVFSSGMVKGSSPSDLSWVLDSSEADPVACRRRYPQLLWL